MFWYGIIAGLFAGFGLSRLVSGPPAQDDMVRRVEAAFPEALAHMVEELKAPKPEGYGFEVAGDAVRPYARKVPLALQALAVYFAMLDARTPLSVKIGIAASLGYVISPIDAVPDAIPGIGWLDDAGAILAAVGIAWSYVHPEHLDRAKKWLEGEGVLVNDDDVNALLDSLSLASHGQVIDVEPTHVPKPPPEASAPEAPRGPAQPRPRRPAPKA